MPGKHHAQGPAPRWGLIAGIIIIVIGLACGSWLLWDKFGGPWEFGSPAATPEPSPAPTNPPTPTPSPSPTPEPTPEPTPTPAPIPDNGEDGYLSEGIYIWNDMAFELFYGYDESAEPYAQAIEGIAEKLPEINVYNMVAPNHSEFGLPQRLRDPLGCGSQRQNTASIYSSYERTIPVDIYDIFNQHKEEYLYFNTDTHWTALGAYYAYVKFCETAGLAPAPLESFSKSTVEGYHGYLYEMTGEDCLYENADHIDLYEPAFDYTAALSYDGWDFTELSGVNSEDSSMGYTMFLWGDNPCIRLENHVMPTGRRLLLVKESYGNAMGAFVAASFGQVYVVDFRKFQGDLAAFCEEWGITDVLFLNSTMAANTYDRVADLEALFP